MRPDRLFVPLLAVALGVCAPAAALACGPYFSVPVLGGGGVVPGDVPEDRFQHAVARWAAQNDVGIEPRLVRTGEGDRVAAARVLDAARLDAYLAARTAGVELDPERFPAEMVLYQRGVVALNQDRLADARAAFRAVLALPDAERQNRATWAAYMLGAIEDRGEDRVSALRKVRELAAAGAHDDLGLAAASFRREADELSAHRPAEALEACGNYVALGGTLGCATGLKSLTRSALATPDGRLRASRLPAAASLVTLLLDSRSPWDRSPERDAEARGFLQAMEGSPVAAPLAGRLAWVALWLDEPALARTWVGRAQRDDAVAAWIDGKLKLRDGDLDGAATAFVRASEGLNAATMCAHHYADARRAVLVELGVVRMAQDRPVEAMDAFLDGGDWMDAAWVGEQVLTTAELKALVDRRAPVVQGFDVDAYGLSGYLPMLAGGEDLPEDAAPALLRGLLGRRLVREGRLAEARPYLPPDAAPHLDQVTADLALGRDTSRSDSDRGAALWRAAFTLKMQGWALSATELEPDQRVLGGWYPGADTAAQRYGTERYGFDQPGALDPTAAERQRAATHGEHGRRYHFVYTSYDLAHEGIDLMPAGHPDLPQAACIAGHWMRRRDATQSYHMWNTLRRRAPDHPLGKALAGRTGWWGLQDDGTCAMPDGSPVPTSSCSSLPAPWTWAWLALPILVRRRRR